MNTYPSLWPLLALALIHFFGGRLSFLGGRHRSIWLSFGGGVSVTYIFLHLLPELNEGQIIIEETSELSGYLTKHVYLIALVGLSVFYGLESAALHTKRKGADPGRRQFWIHIGSFSVYNALIGYLLYQREEGPLQQLILFSIAIALHFIINDYGLQNHFNDTYRHKGRWILVTSLGLGWGAGLMFKMPEAVVALIMAFIGGAIVLNVLKEELPAERESHFLAFAVGAALYAILLLDVL